jgi:two-component system invasion response regulator UvrY
MSKKIKVLVAEDHPLIVKGLVMLLEQLQESIEITTVDSTVDLLQTMQSENPENCLVDLNLSDGLSIRAIEDLLKQYPEANVYVYTAMPSELYIKRLFKLGIHGFLNKKAKQEELVLALEKFLQNEFYISPEFLHLVLDTKSKKNSFELLSTMELTVVEYLSTGLSVKEISNKMVVQPNTVATYKKRAFQKLQVENIIQLNNLYAGLIQK